MVRERTLGDRGTCIPRHKTVVDWDGDRGNGHDGGAAGVAPLRKASVSLENPLRLPPGPARGPNWLISRACRAQWRGDTPGTDEKS